MRMTKTNSSCKSSNPDNPDTDRDRKHQWVKVPNHKHQKTNKFEASNTNDQNQKCFGH